MAAEPSALRRVRARDAEPISTSTDGHEHHREDRLSSRALAGHAQVWASRAIRQIGWPKVSKNDPARLSIWKGRQSWPQTLLHTPPVRERRRGEELATMITRRQPYAKRACPSSRRATPRRSVQIDRQAGSDCGRKSLIVKANARARRPPEQLPLRDGARRAHRRTNARSTRSRSAVSMGHRADKERRNGDERKARIEVRSRQRHAPEASRSPTGLHQPAEVP